MFLPRFLEDPSPLLVKQLQLINVVLVPPVYYTLRSLMTELLCHEIIHALLLSLTLVPLGDIPACAVVWAVSHYEWHKRTVLSCIKLLQTLALDVI